jgi:hypothetical protein
MKTTLKLGVAALAAAGCLMTTTYAAAQQAEGEVGMALPGAQPQRAGAAQGESDHDQMIGRIAIGYMGAYQIPFPGATVEAPAIGIRYWLDQMIGLDLGLGFSNTGGSRTENIPPNSVTTDQAAITGVLIHAGVPLSLASEGHFSFQIVPELNIGFATQTEDIPGGGGTIDRTGLGLGIGARAGGEIHFGFIGVPQLSLQAGVGVLFTLEQDKVTNKPNQGNETSIENTSTHFRTTVDNNPWNIFISNVAALYYF